ncbi:hypothetical protein AtEden1_Chr4g0275861 [Arabidopsis thaliana]
MAIMPKFGATNGKMQTNLYSWPSKPRFQPSIKVRLSPLLPVVLKIAIASGTLPTSHCQRLGRYSISSGKKLVTLTRHAAISTWRPFKAKCIAVSPLCPPDYIDSVSTSLRQPS